MLTAKKERIFALTCGFIVVDGDSVQLQVAVSVVGTGGVDAVFIAYHLPELSTDLVATLSFLNVHYFPHCFKIGTEQEKIIIFLSGLVSG